MLLDLSFKKILQIVLSSIVNNGNRVSLMEGVLVVHCVFQDYSTVKDHFLDPSSSINWI